MSAHRNVLVLLAVLFAAMPVAKAQGIEDLEKKPESDTTSATTASTTPDGEKPGASAAELPGPSAPSTTPGPSAPSTPASTPAGPSAPTSAPTPAGEKPGASAVELPGPSAPTPTTTPNRAAITKPISDDTWTQPAPATPAPLPVHIPQFSLRFGTGPVVLLDAGARVAAASPVLVPGLIAFDWKPTTLSMPLSFRLLYEGSRLASSAYRSTSIDVSVHAFEPSVAYDLAKGIDWNAYGRAGFSLNVGDLNAQGSQGEPLRAAATSFGLLAALGVELAPPPDPGTVFGLLIGAELGWRQLLGGMTFRDVGPTGLNGTEPERIPVTPSNWGTLDTSGLGIRFWAGLRF